MEVSPVSRLCTPGRCRKATHPLTAAVGCMHGFWHIAQIPEVDRSHQTDSSTPLLLLSKIKGRGSPYTPAAAVAAVQPPPAQAQHDMSVCVQVWHEYEYSVPHNVKGIASRRAACCVPEVDKDVR